MAYAVANPDEYLAITGSGIKSIKIVKSAMVWPFQRCQKFSVRPQDYAIDLQAMTKEKLQFLLPVVFTIGPDVENSPVGNEQLPDDRADALKKYAMLLADAETQKGAQKAKHVHAIVRGIIEGEAQQLVSSMTMEEIFAEREEFKRRLHGNIEEELSHFGLRVYNAVVKELR